MLTETEPPCRTRSGASRPWARHRSLDAHGYVGAGAVGCARRWDLVPKGASAEKVSASKNPRRRPVQLRIPRIFRPNSLFGSRSAPATRPAESFTPPLKLSRPVEPTLAQTPSQ